MVHSTGGRSAPFATRPLHLVQLFSSYASASHSLFQPRCARRASGIKPAEGSNYFLIRAINVSAIVAGVSATAMPAAFNASIFPAAVPFPPETIAPA
jgi:hypothetical protein